MSKHTKGPWVIDIETDNKLHKTSIRAQGDMGQMLQVCEINNHVDFKTDGANSRLIAAAPDMFKELENCYKYFYLQSLNGDDTAAEYVLNIKILISKVKG